MKRNWIILGLVAVAVVAVFVSGRWNNDKQDGLTDHQVAAQRELEEKLKTAPKKGSAAPAFTLQSLDGSKSYEVGGARDKVLIVNFWAAWCYPCELEAPDLVRLSEKYKDSFDLYAVNATKYDRLKAAKAFVEEHGFTFPVQPDADNVAGEKYVVYSYPMSFIIGKDGVIRERIEGVIPIEQWEKHLEAAIAS